MLPTLRAVTVVNATANLVSLELTALVPLVFLLAPVPALVVVLAAVVFASVSLGSLVLAASAWTLAPSTTTFSVTDKEAVFVVSASATLPTLELPANAPRVLLLPLTTAPLLLTA